MKMLMSLLSLTLFTFFVFSCNSSDASLSVPEPEITGVVTDYDGKLVSEKPVTIVGRNFGMNPSDVKLLCGVGLAAVSVKADQCTETRLVFTAPKYETGHKLVVRVSVKGVESNSLTLEYDNTLSGDPIPTPEIDEIMKNATITTIREGVEWISFHGKWEGETRSINIVKTKLNEHNKLGIYYEYKSEPDGYNVDDKCEYLDALVGTNGPMACCHFVRVDGEVKRVANDQDPWITNCALTIDNNVPDIVKVKTNYESAALPNQNVGTGGPLLVYEGEIQKYPKWASEAFLKTTHPRTAFGISKDRKTVFHVAVDGRWTSSDISKRAIGMPTDLLAKLMLGLGCYKAMNFDGGGGTAMWIYEHGIVNHPCDSPMNWDNPTLRPSGNTIYIKSDLK
jgi:hypothetical protein